MHLQRTDGKPFHLSCAAAVPACCEGKTDSVNQDHPDVTKCSLPQLTSYLGKQLLDQGLMPLTMHALTLGLAPLQKWGEAWIDPRTGSHAMPF